LPHMLSEKLDCFYKEIDSIDDVNLAELYSIVQQKAKITVTLERHQVKARKLQRQFMRFFGIPALKPQ
ncbi:hypothetical protein OAO01_05890, partial [Oligoflexia bacterium]|nr:hypothetical protein [Oligoflexia bacterium]